MSSITTSLIAFICIFGGAILGMWLRRVLPERHLSADSKDSIKVGVALVGTMTALVLGLLLASAKGAYDAQTAELTQLSANSVLLDRVLAHYGHETKDVRDLLSNTLGQMADRFWSRDQSDPSHSDPSSGAELVYDKIHQLSPKDDAQRSLKLQALSIAVGLGQTRWLMYEQKQTHGLHTPSSSGARTTARPAHRAGRAPGENRTRSRENPLPISDSSSSPSCRFTPAHRNRDFRQSLNSH